MPRLRFTLQSGEPGSLVGAMTMTLRLLLDFLRPTSGEARILNRPAWDASMRARIGYLPADLKPEPTYTGTQALGYFAALRRLRQGHTCRTHRSVRI